MEQSPFSGVHSHSAGQEISHLLWIPKIHYHGHWNLPQGPVMSQVIKVVKVIEQILTRIIYLAKFYKEQ
jgi:hypothetical protein